MTTPTFDDTDAGLLAARIAKRDAMTGPRVGDFARMPCGKMVRFSHHLGDSIQTTDGRFGASFYLGRDGHADFSGGLDPAIPLARMSEERGSLRMGAFWFFHHDHVRAHNGVTVKVPCRVFNIEAA